MCRAMFLLCLTITMGVLMLPFLEMLQGAANTLAIR